MFQENKSTTQVAQDEMVTGMPSGMTMERVVGSDGQARITLYWTPGAFAAQTAPSDSGSHNTPAPTTSP